MTAKYLFVHNGCYWEAIETVSKCFPQLDIITSFALVIKSINPVDGSTLVVSLTRRNSLDTLSCRLEGDRWSPSSAFLCQHNLPKTSSLLLEEILHTQTVVTSLYTDREYHRRFSKELLVPVKWAVVKIILEISDTDPGLQPLSSVLFYQVDFPGLQGASG